MTETNEPYTSPTTPPMHQTALQRYRSRRKWYATGPEPPNEVTDISKVLSLLDIIEAGHGHEILPVVLLNENLAITGSHRLAASEIAEEYGYPRIPQILLDDLDIPTTEKDRIREFVEEAGDFDYAQSILDEPTDTNLNPATNSAVSPDSPDVGRLRQLLVEDHIISRYREQKMKDSAIIKKARDVGFTK